MAALFKEFRWLVAPAWALGISAYLMSVWYETHGWTAARPLMVPISLAFLPLMARSPRLRRMFGGFAAVLLGSYCMAGMHSVGIYYMPGAVALMAALVLEFKAGTHDGR